MSWSASARGAAEKYSASRRCRPPSSAPMVSRRLAARAQPGVRVQVAAGERIPVDGKVIVGGVEIDASPVTGETISFGQIGSVVHAGTLNLGQPIMVQATATDDNTLVAEIAH